MQKFLIMAGEAKNGNVPAELNERDKRSAGLLAAVLRGRGADTDSIATGRSVIATQTAQALGARTINPYDLLLDISVPNPASVDLPADAIRRGHEILDDLPEEGLLVVQGITAVAMDIAAREKAGLSTDGVVIPGPLQVMRLDLEAMSLQHFDV